MSVGNNWQKGPPGNPAQFYTTPWKWGIPRTGIYGFRGIVEGHSMLISRQWPNGFPFPVDAFDVSAVRWFCVGA